MRSEREPAHVISLELLGAPCLRVDGAEQRLPSRRLLALLAYLALEGRSSRGRLSTLFWGELDESSARRNLRRELARLRDAGLEAALDTGDDSLALAPAVTTDVASFLAFDAQDAPEQATAAYRGPLLDGFALADAPQFDEWLLRRREELARRWRDALAKMAQDAEARGDARAALACHARLLEDDPLQEAHYAALMRLHYLLGERAAALDTFERCRHVLREELGLEPLPETAALAERIRAAEKLAPLATRAAAGLVRFEAALIGRAAELARIGAAGAPVVLVIGEAGVGKSRLMSEAARRLPAAVSIRCAEIARDAPFYAITEALSGALDDAERAAGLAALPAEIRRELARLLPQLASGAPEADEPKLSPEAARTRLFEALAVAFTAWVGAAGALCFDDLHWADTSTLAFVVHLAHRRARTPDCTPRVLATARVHELAEREPARDALRLLERSGLAQRIELAPFDEATTLALLRALSGTARGDRFAARLQRATAGNVFFVLETLRYLFDSGELAIGADGQWSTRYDDATTDYAELPVPPTVRQTVLERVERLGPAARRVLETAALTADGFTLDEVRPATALSDWEALEGLERAVGVQLLAEMQTVPRSAYRFAHDLARDALASSLSGERRRLIHGRLAQTLEAQQARPDRIAFHFEQAGRGTEALRWRIAAAEAAERVFAQREALAHYAAALALGPDLDRQIEIRRARIELLRTLHDLAGMDAELDALDALAAQANAPALEAESLAWRVRVRTLGQRFAEAIELAHRAWAHAGFAALPSALRDQMVYDAVHALTEVGRYAEARALCERELERADQGPGHRGRIYHALAYLATSFDDCVQAERHLRQAVDLLTQAGDVEGRQRSLNILAYAYTKLGDDAASLACLEQALADGERLHNVAMQRNSLANLIKVCLQIGEFERAEILLDRLTKLLRFVSDNAAQHRLQLRRAEVRAARGELGAALAAARESVRLIEENRGGAPDFYPWYLLARLLWCCGDRDAATAVYRDLPRSPAYLPKAEPAVSFFSTIYQLPERAAAIADRLDAAAAPPIDLNMPEALIAYWRAYAYFAAGGTARALAVLEPDGVPLAAPPLIMHPASPLALRLAVRSALALDCGEPIDAAERMLPKTPALEAIELRRQLAAALQARADGAQRAAAHRAAARSEVARLAASLAAAPALRAKFEALHADLLGGR